MRRLIKSLAYRVAPGPAERFFVRRQRQHLQRMEQAWDLPRLNAAVAERFDYRIAGGPFAGMKYEKQASGSTLAPKILGSYEAEIAPWIERLCQGPLELVIDVGCAEGYYAVGMAWRNPSVHVLAFDIDSVARTRCAGLAKLNGVDGRVKVQARCDPETLSAAIIGNTLVICDVEGYEDQLLDPTAAPNLLRAILLVELHDRFVPGVTQRLKARFAPSHRWHEVASRDRQAADYPIVQFLDATDRDRALSEKRGGPQSWALLVPHDAGFPIGPLSAPAPSTGEPRQAG
jgi:hypothetical protein